MQAFHTEGPDLADRCLEMVRKEALGVCCGRVSSRADEEWRQRDFQCKVEKCNCLQGARLSDSQS